MKRSSAFLLAFSCFAAAFWAPAFAAPAATTSRYMATTNYTTLYNEGCRMGQSGLSGAVILDFGQPWHQNGLYGSILFGNLNFASVRQIQRGVEGYLAGFYNCSSRSAFVKLGVGTSNYDANTGYVTSAHGAAWAGMVNALNSWIATKGYASQEYVRGANDMELDWDTATQTRSWVSGYNAATSAWLYDYGDAAGCPPYGHCNNGWTQDDLWYVSWGAHVAIPFPEIYTTDGSQAQEWYQESLFSALHEANGKLGFLGTLTQYAACGCGNQTNTPSQGFDQLQNAIDGDSRTAYAISYSSDITWSN